MIQEQLDVVYEELRKLHETHAKVGGFCAFPDDVKPQAVAAFTVPSTDLFVSEQGLGQSEYPALRDALVAISPAMLWRETYKDTDIGADFMDRFGCYEIIGRDAPFASEKMRSFMVYHPPHLHYPWHHHPAEELYMVIAGQAEFHMQGREAAVLKSGETAFHPASVPHALTSHNHPVLTYVIWRDDFDVAPVWSQEVA